MGLRDATDAGGRRLLEDGPAWVGPDERRRLQRPDLTFAPDDPWVTGGGSTAHGYLDAARAAWDEAPDHMDVLDPASPVARLKAVERDLYLHHWTPWLDDPGVVMDVGCGVGRFVQPFLARGCDVVGVDPDDRALRACLAHAADLPGRLDLRWSRASVLPDVAVDTVLAVEVLCYVPDAEAALEAIVARLRPGGRLLLSMEARWGWAASPDVPPGTVGHALVGDGVLDLPGDGWTQTWEEGPLVALLEAAGLAVEGCLGTHYVLDGPLEQATGGVPDLEIVLDLEAAARAHPVWSPLNRIWTVAAVRT